MANFSFVSGAKFRPFSYSEMLAPLQQATTAQMQLEDAYGELGTKASVFDKMANEQTDPQAYAMYKQYSDDLAKQAESLAKQGLTPASRQGLMDMRKKYSSEIVPIEQAYKRRQELTDEQRKARLADDSLMYESDASTISLDDLVKNPNMSYTPLSGKNIRTTVAQEAAAIAKEARKDPRAWRQILDGQYYETMMQKGASSEEVLAAMQGDINANPRLRQLVTDAVASSGVMDWKGVKDKDGNLTEYGKKLISQVESYAKQGLWNAVGETQYQQLSNKAYEKAKTPDTGLYYRAVPKTTVDGDKKTTQMNANLQVLREVQANPALLDQASTRTVREPHLINPYPMTNRVGPVPVSIPTRQETYYPYREKLAELSKRYGNINYTITDGVLTGGNLGELAQKLENDIRSSAVRAFSYKPNITQSDLITQVLKENTRSYYRRSNSTGLWKLDDNKKGDEVAIGALNNYFTSDADIDFDPDLGFIINATDSNGETRSAILNTELLDDQNRTFSRAQQAIEVALENGEDELATTLIDATMEAFYKRYNTLERRQSNTFSKEE